MRITVVISSNRGGGSVWAATQWANAWAARGESVTLVTIFPSEGVGEFFRLHEGVTLQRLDLDDRPAGSRLAAGLAIARNLLRLRRAVARSKPDVVIAFDGPVISRTLLACRRLAAAQVAMEQAHPGYYHYGAFWERWRDRLYPQAAAVVNLTQAASDWCGERLGVRLRPVIHNPVHPARFRAALEHAGSLRIIAGARMVEQKRLDLLIEAFSRIAERHPDWRLAIFGDGPLRPELEALVAAKGLANRVDMPGWTQDMALEMSRSDLFALSSEYEGFGNVIAEALAAGLPAVSFDCPSGPADIIRDGVDGLLARPLDASDLADKLDRLMGDRALRLQMGQRAVEVVERFTMTRTLELWDELFSRILPSGRKTGAEPAQHNTGTTMGTSARSIRAAIMAASRLHDRIYAGCCGAVPRLFPWHFQWLSTLHLVRDLRRILPGVEGRVLDLGCGLQPYRTMLGRATTYTGADISAKPGTDTVVFEPGKQLPFADDSFDAVLCTQVLEHVADAEESIREIKRILRPGGRLIVSVPSIYQLHGAPHDYRRLTEYGLRALLQGFQVDHVSRHGGAGSAIGILMLNFIHCRMSQSTALWCLKAAALPLWIPFCLLVNLLAVAADAVDNTAMFSHNLLAAARRN